MQQNSYHHELRPQETVGRFAFQLTGYHMDIGHIEGATLVVGKSQGYLGLPVRDGVRACHVVGGLVPTMTTAWFPNPEELAALNAGAAIHVSIDGNQVAPMMVAIGPVPDKN